MRTVILNVWRRASREPLSAGTRCDTNRFEADGATAGICTASSTLDRTGPNPEDR
jgi:hypothetical protein